MKHFQLYSDLHLELKTDYIKFDVIAENLILAGDIGKITEKHFKDFIIYASKNWKKIFIILGNHEYYYKNSHFIKTKEKYKAFYDSFDNVYFLDKTVVELENTILIGATFWSKVDEKYKHLLNDFKFIKYFDKIKKRKYEITCDFINKLHYEEKEWLLHTLDILKNTKKTIIIISHFPLTQIGTSHPKYAGQPKELLNYFSNDFSDIFSKYTSLKIINVAGHTHYNYDIIYDNLRFISNQIECEEELFYKKDLLISI
ncbi:hypothetical protein crov393 [Cafeteria roenbergensis virus]|uniref:Calcineurin-like phosphoesterase domain-containing protein n=1 Tax=Cafeteria roenbergensis virus (strain BV-PW1) TaxID=693272 RepID=E3T5G4_CROVB|nr:metallo-phosphoesterase [Cafeteria roenbergensis virus BV-PW1]ADO67427.1 hypothetical protein crov393 [Cafeteria roenbergensis virus BV-PW1]